MSKPIKKHRKKSKNECGSKVAYDTLELADAAAFRPYSKSVGRGFLKAYKCRICKKFHYGHSTL